MERYYYKSKDGKSLYNLDTPVKNGNFVEITKEEYQNIISSNEEKSKKRKEKLANQEELKELLKWFEYYDIQVSEYNRSVRLGEEWDGDIEALDAEATTKAARIRELRG